MKFLKFIVILMGILIFLGTTAIIYIVFDNLKKIKTNNIFKISNFQSLKKFKIEISKIEQF